METVRAIRGQQRVENAGYNGMIAHVTETIRINHDGEVNKSRRSPALPIERGTCRKSPWSSPPRR